MHVEPDTNTYLFFYSSLGCKAIFLLGGKSRNDQPLAMFLRSGDIVLMSGEARERFHGQHINYLCSYLSCFYALCNLNIFSGTSQVVKYIFGEVEFTTL